MAKTCRLIEQTLVEHDVFRGGLRLPKSDLFGDVTISVSLVLGLV